MGTLRSQISIQILIFFAILNEIRATHVSPKWLTQLQMPHMMLKEIKLKKFIYRTSILSGAQKSFSMELCAPKVCSIIAYKIVTMVRDDLRKIFTQEK